MSETNLNVLPPMMFEDDVTLVPIGDNVVIRPEAHDRVTVSGLVLPAADRTRPLVGRIIAVGAGRYTKDRTVLPMPLKRGDRVIYHRYEGTEVKPGAKPALLILELEDVLAIVTETKDVREELAALCHEQWSGWMKYLFARCCFTRDGAPVIAKEDYQRWKRQTQTAYAKLSEGEQNSDRKEADRFLAIIDHTEIVTEKKR